MRLVAQIYVTVPADVVRRNPTLLEKLKRGLGGAVNLETSEVQNQLEATAVVDAGRRALARLGVANALSLVIDDNVIFQDTDGRPEDLPDLVLALSEHASVFGRGFRELRFAAEHEEAGLHLVIETRARTRHHRAHPAAVVSVGGRLRALEPRSGESAEAYRARVEPLTRDAAAFEAARHAFDSFVARLGDALKAVMPEAKVEEKRAEARVVKAPGAGISAGAATDAVSSPERAPSREPTHPAYDPFVFYYPSPMGAMLDAMVFTSFMHMMMPPPVLVVSPHGAHYGNVGDIQANPELAATDLDAHHGDAELASYDDGGHGGDHDHGGSVDDGGGSFDDGGGWSDGGGGFDGGGGGFDGGGGDFGGGGLD